jgi:hypothetical protein
VHRPVPQAQPPTPPAPTGVDYLGLVLAAHDAETLGQLAFRDLPIEQPEDGPLEDYRTKADHADTHQTQTDDYRVEDHQPEEDRQA